MEPFLAQIQPFGFNFAPRGWSFCEGQLLPISSNQALFSLLGTTFGGDGRTTFGLPDLRGRTPIHFGQGPGLSPYSLGQKGGAESVTLTEQQIPSHTHPAQGTVRCNAAPGDEDSAVDNYSAAHTADENYAAEADELMADNNVAVAVSNTGGNQSHTNMQPYLAINWCIATTGVFPSRS